MIIVNFVIQLVVWVTKEWCDQFVGAILSRTQRWNLGHLMSNVQRCPSCPGPVCSVLRGCPEGQAFAGIVCIDAKVVSEKIRVRLAI